jgi:hypothetical protein
MTKNWGENRVRVNQHLFYVFFICCSWCSIPVRFGRGECARGKNDFVKHVFPHAVKGEFLAGWLGRLWTRMAGSRKVVVCAFVNIIIENTLKVSHPIQPPSFRSVY